MSSSKCAKCEQTVYPVEGLRCLDKIWHKGCFKCHECNMTLNMKNYKGFEKQPYCNAHCPQAKATAVADTPEIRRLAENTRIQSQAKYHEDFEKSKGKGFTAIADDPETLRIKNTSKIISNVAYHGELERKKQMEEKRGLSGREEVGNNAIGAITKNNSRMLQTKQEADYMTNQSNNNNNNTGQHQQKQQQPNITQQQKHHHQQQQLIKQQQMQSAQQDQPNNHQVVINQHRQSQQVEGQVQHQPIKQTQQYSVSQQQQQQLIMRQQQQHQMMLQQQQQRQLLESQMSRQPSKQSNNYPQQQHMMKAISGQQHPMKYMPINEAMVNHHHHQSSPSHHMVAGGGGPPHLINPTQMGAISNNQVRMGPNGVIMASNGSAQMSHHLVHGGQYGHGHQINGVMPCKQPQFVGHPPPRHMINPNQQPINHHMMRPPHNHQPILHQQQQQQQAMQQQQVPRRAYRAMYDYVANDVDEVSFIENDILIDCVNVDGNWLIGKVARSGQTGMLPANYVSELSM